MDSKSFGLGTRVVRDLVKDESEVNFVPDCRKTLTASIEA
jgi:hypothetical protein